MTLAIKRRRDQKGRPTSGWALLLGSVMPDVPLTIFTIAYFIHWRWFTDRSTFIFGPAYDAIYFENPFMIAAHNLFHAPILILGMALAGYWLMRRSERENEERRAPLLKTSQSKTWSTALFWFAMGCGFHSIVDILTHHDDGPLLLFPFNWHLRFISPVSYWDARYYGNIFGIFEMALDIAIIIWLIWLWWRHRQMKRPTQSSTEALDEEH